MGNKRRTLILVVLAVTMAFGALPAIGSNAAKAEEALQAESAQTLVAQESEHTHDATTFLAWTDANALPTVAGSYYLDTDVTLAQTWETPGGATNICLNGHKIIGDFDGADSGSVLKVIAGAELRLYDCTDEGALQPAEKRTISYGVDVLGNGVLTLNNGTITGFESGVWTDLQAGDEENKASFGKFVMNGGTIKGNSQRGVYVFSGTFEMNGGTICQNGDSGDDGAGVYVNYSTFKMSGGEISNNTAKRDGGGVYLFRTTDLTMTGGVIKNNSAVGNGGGAYLNGSTFTVSGGSIEGNQAGANGGGVYAINRFNDTHIGDLVLTGGSIVGNSAANLGGGVFISNKSKMDLSGTASVVGNEANGVAGNVYLDNALITVTGKLADSAAIGVTRVSADVAAEAATGAETDKDAFTTGYKSTGNSVDPETYFFSDDDKKLVGWTRDGEEARFVDAYTVTVNDTQNGTVESSKSKARAGDTVFLTITPDEGYALSSLLVTDANKEAVEVVDNAFTMPQSDVTVDATFAATHCTISFDANGGTGIMDDQVVAKGETIALNENEFSRSGYAFTGWNTAKNGSGASFKDKEEVSVTSNMKLYAQWKASPSGSSNAGSATGSTTESRTSLASTADSSSCAGTVACVLLGVTAVTAGLRKTAFRKR